MASSRRKQDEKNLKTLRELGALPSNKYCFDCNQRGPTYVNVTIGSFVCTKCSGILRGITPPHRVKSISMATFTNEEIDLLKSRGNDYCRQVWLGLYEGTPPSTNADETSVKDFMVEKYERRSYYLDPVNVKPSEESKVPKVNGTQVQPTQRPRPEISKNNITRNSLNLVNSNTNGTATKINNNGFADFDKADIFIGGTTTVVNGVNNKEQQNGFANFDNNPVFNNSNGSNTASATNENFSIFDLSFSEPHGPVLNQVPLFPKCTISRWSLPIPSSFHNINTSWNHSNTSTSLNGSLNSTNALNGNSTMNGTPLSNPAAPVEDRYAALKDLDNEFKSQKNGSIDWTSSTNSSSSNGSLYSSPTPTGSVYSSPSPQSSIFGSPSQGQFMTAFPPSQDPFVPSVVSNPFNTNGMVNGMTNSVNWLNLNGVQSAQQPFANPFRDNQKTNGYTQGFQTINAFPTNAMPLAVNGTNGWTPNPFKVGGTTASNSNNPFL